MSVHIYVRATRLKDVVGRVDYISNPDRQENLLATATTTTEPNFWHQLAADSQDAWRTAGGSREKVCCEGRELHGDLPNCALKRDLEVAAKKIAQHFKERTGHECIVAIHLNKKKTNLHYHIVYSERLRLEEPDITIADRNAFLDENGIRKRTKKEILDEHGELREGCRIVPKGEVLHERYFAEKETCFGEKQWLHDLKVDMSDWINQEYCPDELREVYRPDSPYLPQIHVGKGVSEEKKKDIEAYNSNVKVINRAIRDGVISEEDGRLIKGRTMLSPAWNEAFIAGWEDLFPKGRKLPEFPGGERNRNTGEAEDKKQRLRELYREAAEFRRKARETYSSVDQKIYQAKARGCSAEIDRLKAQLGYATDQEKQAAIQKTIELLKKNKEWEDSLRRQGNNLRRRKKSLNISLSKQRQYLGSAERYARDHVSNTEAWFRVERLQEGHGNILRVLRNVGEALEKNKAQRAEAVAKRQELKALLKMQRQASSIGRPTPTHSR